MNSQSPSFLTNLLLFAVAFFGFFIDLIYHTVHLLTPLIWASIMTLAACPLYRKMLLRFNEKRRLAAGIATFSPYFVIKQE